MAKLTKQEKIANAGFAFKPVLFLDADWTIRKPKTEGATFIKDENDIELIPGIKEALINYVETHVMVIVSNQGGIAHNFKTEAQVEREFDVTVALLNDPVNLISREYVFYSPFLEDGKLPPYNNRSTMRKPNIGMATTTEIFLLTRHQIMINWDDSIMVGDSTDDEQFANNLNIRFININDFINVAENQDIHTEGSSEEGSIDTTKDL